MKTGPAYKRGNMNIIGETTGGRLRGVENNGIISFKGVPFTAPPSGSNRFLPPQPVIPWSGVQDANTVAPTPPQAESLLSAGLPPQAEDCLGLNVWTPALDNKKRPVMAWIHGGAFLSLSASSPGWDGETLAKLGDVVIVTIPYRLGALGFLHLGPEFGEDYAESGNNGILDQIAGLEWIRDNISAFGGNSDNVTVFGESAGAMSIGTMLGMPSAQGLFHKAILESGAASSATTLEKAQGITTRFLDAVSVQPGDIQALQALDVAAILEGQMQCIDNPLMGEAGATQREPEQDPLSDGIPFAPVINGLSLPQPPLDAIIAGSSANIPLLLLTCNNEWRLFSELLTVPTPDEAEFFSTWLEKLTGQDGTEAAGLYTAPYEELDDTTETKIRFAAAQAITDVAFEIPATRLLDAQHAHQSTLYRCRFDWPTPLFGGRLGACHGLEISFVFGVPVGGMALAGTDQPEHLTQQIQQAWLAFARTSNPNHKDIEEWPPYDPETRSTMLFNTTTQALNDPIGSKRRSLWKNL